jgi:hypothetical protein
MPESLRLNQAVREGCAKASWRSAKGGIMARSRCHLEEKGRESA